MGYILINEIYQSARNASTAFQSFRLAVTALIYVNAIHFSFCLGSVAAREESFVAQSWCEENPGAGGRHVLNNSIRRCPPATRRGENAVRNARLQHGLLQRLQLPRTTDGPHAAARLADRRACDPGCDRDLDLTAPGTLGSTPALPSVQAQPAREPCPRGCGRWRSRHSRSQSEYLSYLSIA